MGLWSEVDVATALQEACVELGYDSSHAKRKLVTPAEPVQEDLRCVRRRSLLIAAAARCDIPRVRAPVE